ncbi:MAG: hypothetical protein JWQ75_3484 [Pseudarthrobacter sp.]|nr:hypothetical protein [Pseudarthrobacter sp.]
MDYSRLSYTFLNDVNLESRSALPHAPVVPVLSAGRTRKTLYVLRGRLASGLHRAAWAIEPPLPTEH